jgi:hypothetical protein
VEFWAHTVIGTHIHLPTADARILPCGTAYVSDVGMTGSTDGIIGFDKDDFSGSLLGDKTVAYRGIERPVPSQRRRRRGRGRKQSGDRDRGRVQRVDMIEHAAGLRPFTRCFGTCSLKEGKQTGDDATDVIRC